MQLHTKELQRLLAAPRNKGEARKGSPLEPSEDRPYWAGWSRSSASEEPQALPHLTVSRIVSLDRVSMV